MASDRPQLDIPSIVDLGHRYMYGDSSTGIDKDPVRGLAYFKQAAELGDVTSLYNVGVCYERGYGTSRNIKSAIHYYKQAAKLASAGDISTKLISGTAMYNMALIFFNGTDVKQDMKYAVELYKQSIDCGHMPSKNNLAICYLYGNESAGIEKNIELAIKMYHELVELNEPYITYLLGTWYYNGKFVIKDLEKAFRLFERASKLNNIDAIYSLGKCYYNGYGVRQDYKKAVNLFEQSTNNKLAVQALAVCYERGYGVNIDTKKARDLYVCAKN
jgi:TPR repeat protein